MLAWLGAVLGVTTARAEFILESLGWAVYSRATLELEHLYICPAFRFLPSIQSLAPICAHGLSHRLSNGGRGLLKWTRAEKRQQILISSSCDGCTPSVHSLIEHNLWLVETRSEAWSSGCGAVPMNPVCSINSCSGSCRKRERRFWPRCGRALRHPPVRRCERGYHSPTGATARCAPMSGVTQMMDC